MLEVEKSYNTHPSPHCPQAQYAHDATDGGDAHGVSTARRIQSWPVSGPTPHIPSPDRPQFVGQKGKCCGGPRKRVQEVTARHHSMRWRRIRPYALQSTGCSASNGMRSTQSAELESVRGMPANHPSNSIRAEKPAARAASPPGQQAVGAHHPSPPRAVSPHIANLSKRRRQSAISAARRRHAPIPQQTGTQFLGSQSRPNSPQAYSRGTRYALHGDRADKGATAAKRRSAGRQKRLEAVGTYNISPRVDATVHTKRLQADYNVAVVSRTPQPTRADAHFSAWRSTVATIRGARAASVKPFAPGTTCAGRDCWPRSSHQNGRRHPLATHRRIS